MPVTPLTNDRWGFDTNCFVCETRNDRGLQVPFGHDTDADLVVAEVTLADHLSGAPSWVHGGVVLAILDEAMAWATIAVRHRWAVTKHSEAWFDRPVIVDRPYRVEAWIVGGDDDGELEAEATVVSASSGKVCVRARATMSVVTPVQVPGLGIDVEGAGEGFVAERPQASG